MDTNPPLERLRLAAALAHTVPGAELRLHPAQGQSILVARHPAAEIDPCDLRRTVLAAACPARPDPSRWIDRLELAGSLADEGLRLYRDLASPLPRWWTVTLLRHGAVAEAIGAIAIDHLPDDAVEATLVPDNALGVTAVRIEALRAGFGVEVHALAVAVNAALAARELVIQVGRSGRTSRSGPA